MNNRFNNYNRQNTPMIAGVILLIVGMVILLKQLGIYLPHWLFGWQTIIIVIGLYIGAKRNFEAPYTWTIPILIGGLSIFSRYIDLDLSRFIFPIIFIAAGLVIILNANNSPRWLKEIQKDANDALKKKDSNVVDAEIVSDINSSTNYTGSTFSQSQSTGSQSKINEDEYINTTSFFVGVKRNVLSKNFKGGDIVTIMGGCEINLMQADMQSPAIVNLTQIMGGARILVPPHWEVKNEIVALMGGIEDKRPMINNTGGERKILILKGITIMGGIDIKSY